MQLLANLLGGTTQEEDTPEKRQKRLQRIQREFQTMKLELPDGVKFRFHNPQDKTDFSVLFPPPRPDLKELLVFRIQLSTRYPFSPPTAFCISGAGYVPDGLLLSSGELLLRRLHGEWVPSRTIQSIIMELIHATRLPGSPPLTRTRAERAQKEEYMRFPDGTELLADEIRGTFYKCHEMRSDGTKASRYLAVTAKTVMSVEPHPTDDTKVVVRTDSHLLQISRVAYKDGVSLTIHLKKRRPFSGASTGSLSPGSTTATSSAAAAGAGNTNAGIGVGLPQPTGSPASGPVQPLAAAAAVALLAASPASRPIAMANPPPPPGSDGAAPPTPGAPAESAGASTDDGVAAPAPSHHIFLMSNPMSAVNQIQRNLAAIGVCGKQGSLDHRVVSAARREAPSTRSPSRLASSTAGDKGGHAGRNVARTGTMSLEPEPIAGVDDVAETQPLNPRSYYDSGSGPEGEGPESEATPNAGATGPSGAGSSGDPMVDIAEMVAGMATNPSLSLVHKITDMHMMAVQSLGDHNNERHEQILAHLHQFLQRSDVRNVLETSVEQKREAETGDWLPFRGSSKGRGSSGSRSSRRSRFGSDSRRPGSSRGSRRGQRNDIGEPGVDFPADTVQSGNRDSWTGIPYARRIGEEYVSHRGQSARVRVAEQGSLLDKRWTCSYCTLVNRPQLFQCEACGSPKEQEPSSSLSDMLARAPSRDTLAKAHQMAKEQQQARQFARRAAGVTLHSATPLPTSPGPRVNVRTAAPRAGPGTNGGNTLPEDWEIERFPGARQPDAAGSATSPTSSNASLSESADASTPATTATEAAE